MKTTLTAQELGLRPAVAPINESASGASLAGLTGVDKYNLTPFSFCLVLKESPELQKRPRVQSSAGFPVINLNPVTNVREVLKHDSSTCINIPDNRGRNSVVTIPSESLFTTSEASKMPLGTLRTVGLQCTPETKNPFNNFLHVAIPMKLIIGTHGGSGHSQIHSDGFPIGNKFNIRKFDNHMKIKPVLTEREVGGSGRITNRISSILGNIEGNLHPAAGSREIHNACFPIQNKSVQVVTGRTTQRLRATSLSSLLLSGNSRLHRFTGFLAGLDVQVRYKIRQSILTMTVGKTMKRVGVTVMLLPTSTADSIERLSKLAHCFMQSTCLFCRWFEKYPYRSVHTNIIPYTRKILQYKEVNRNSSVA